MKLSSNQLERLADRVFRVLKASGHIEMDAQVDERIEDRVLETILSVLEDDTRTEDRLSREAERLVDQQKQVVSRSERPREELVMEVKARLAKSKRVLLDDGPERADVIGEKVLRALWRVDGVDFFSEDVKVQNCIAKAIFRFRMEDDRVVDAVERLVARKTTEEAYSPKWCVVFDRYMNDARQRLAARHAPGAAPVAGNGTEPALEV